MEFKGNFRVTCEIYKEFFKQSRKKLHILNCIIILASFFLSSEFCMAYIIVMLLTIPILNNIIKKSYYDNRKRYMQESLVTINSEGISDISENNFTYVSSQDIYKIIETKNSFFIYMSRQNAFLLAKNQFVNNNHIKQLRYILAQYYSHVPQKLLTEDYTGGFKPIVNQESIKPEPQLEIIYGEADEQPYNNKLSVICLYIFVSLAVIVACVAPVKKNTDTIVSKDSIEEPEESRDYTAEALNTYIECGNKLLSLQEEYKTADKRISGLDDIYDTLDNNFYSVDFNTENRDAMLVLMYRFDSLCFNLIYIMDKPYSELNYIEKDEYEKTISQVQEYMDKLKNISSAQSGKV